MCPVYPQVNQIGTVTESIDAVRMAKAAGWGVMTSHRCVDAVCGGTAFRLLDMSFGAYKGLRSERCGCCCPLHSAPFCVLQVRRDGGHVHCGPCRGPIHGPDQDRRPVPLRAPGQVQPGAASARKTWCGGRGGGRRAEATLASLCFSALASGVCRSAHSFSPSLCPTNDERMWACGARAWGRGALRCAAAAH